MSRFTIKEQDYINVVRYFNNNHDNSTPEIARQLKLTKNYVNFILTKYLNKLKQYYVY